MTNEKFCEEGCNYESVCCGERTIKCDDCPSTISCGGCPDCQDEIDREKELQQARADAWEQGYQAGVLDEAYTRAPTPHARTKNPHGPTKTLETLAAGERVREAAERVLNTWDLRMRGRADYPAVAYALSRLGQALAAAPVEPGVTFTTSLAEYEKLRQLVRDELRYPNDHTRRQMQAWFERDAAPVEPGGEVGADPLTAREALATAELRSNQLLMIASELCGDPKIGSDDTSDPRWTPTLREAGQLRRELEAARAEVANRPRGTCYKCAGEPDLRWHNDGCPLATVLYAADGKSPDGELRRLRAFRDDVEYAMRRLGSPTEGALSSPQPSGRGDGGG